MAEPSLRLVRWAGRTPQLFRPCLLLEKLTGGKQCQTIASTRPHFQVCTRCMFKRRSARIAQRKKWIRRSTGYSDQAPALNPRRSLIKGVGVRRSCGSYWRPADAEDPLPGQAGWRACKRQNHREDFALMWRRGCWAAGAPPYLSNCPLPNSYRSGAAQARDCDCRVMTQLQWIEKRL